MLKVQCPKCRNTMLYNPLPPRNSPSKKISLSKKTKKCVYCGHTFKIIYSKSPHNNIVSRA